MMMTLEPLKQLWRDAVWVFGWSLALVAMSGRSR
jgi:hypothetical protein